ncbi:MAG: hypothetical protein AB1571_03425 [Nanoarchaeota archaeon]
MSGQEITLYDEESVERLIEQMEEIRLCYCKFGMLYITDFDTKKNHT